jgi:hypothetical protein
MTRGETVMETEGRRWRAVEAWRAESGLGLVYFLPLDEGAGVAEEDREDRRAALEPGETVEGLEGEALRERLGRATPLTGTERRFRAPDGRLWLAQSVGPVWADGVASGLTGLLFTALEGPAGRAIVGGGHAGEMSDGELAERWRRAVEGSGEDGPGEADEPSSTRRPEAETEG